MKNFWNILLQLAIVKNNAILRRYNKGFDKAQHELGVCYNKGNGVEQDYETAVEWFRKASRQGYPGKQKDELARFKKYLVFK